MHIQEIIMEGFKSYATRTVISGWDPEFNAITGLNGSGKSNVLDAICFLLGISNLSQVRASNLQDLIYKKGQAGVTKATVSIVFDNSDPKNCPIGYEKDPKITVTRQIVLRGKNKYLVNGHNVPQKVVSNLFQSVQLNVNNPHFLIMQGRITKVLNMKPPEILALVEEAAGTRMFEDKKEAAIATISKKEKKLEEIQTLLREEITPKFEKLRKEKALYLEFQKTEAEIERLKKLVVAYEYFVNQEKLNTSETDFKKKSKKIEDLKHKSEVAQTELTETNEQIKQLGIKKQKEASSQLGKFEEKAEKLSESLVRVKTQTDNKRETVKEESKKHEALLANRQELLESLKQKEAEFAKSEVTFQDLKKSHDAKVEEAKKSEDLLEALSTGLSTADSEKGFVEQLQAAKNHSTTIASETQQAKLKLSHLSAELKELEPKAKKMEKENGDVQKTLEETKKAIAAIEKELAGLKHSPEKEADLVKRKAAEEDVINGLRTKCEALSSKLSQLQFSFTDPTPGFDRRTVRGLVADLVSIPKENFDASTALEVCAGGMLYFVVVANEKVASQLLEKGQLQKRVTIIPLTKIQPPNVDPKRITSAKKLAPGKVDVALSFVCYENELAPAMNFVFGQTLICKDKDTAKLVTFDNSVRMRSVTYDGDIYDPQGTLTGGSAPANANCLIKLQELREVKSQLAEHEATYNQICQELESLKKVSKKHQELKQKLDLKQHELNLFKDQISKSPYGQVLEQLEKTRALVAESQKVIDSSEARLKEANEKCKQIEKEMNELSTNRGDKLAKMKKSLDKLKGEVANETKTFKKRQQEIQTLQLEIEQLKADIKTAEEQIKSSEESIAVSKKEEKQLVTELAKISDLYDEAKEVLQAERDKLVSFDRELHSLEAHKKAKDDEIHQNNLQVQQLEHEIQRFQKDRQAATASVKALEKGYPWVLDQRQHFGQQGTLYDFNAQNPAEARKRLDQLEEKQNKLGKNVNRKVMDMLDRVEKEETSLKKKLAIVLNDKQMIEETITTLDVKKKEALQRTWEKVNKDFGAIFGDLLPGNSAKLDLPEGLDITHGLEIKVNLGGIWKQSLTELSGGQRSLVALSLILSLLCFKPAPLYILDEIDAALDLSHTQNIGQLLKNRFKGAQFIVVSLKEGMFTNANVLFKAKFRDGVSHIERHVQHQSSSSSVASASSSSSSNQGASSKGKKVMRVEKENDPMNMS